MDSKRSSTYSRLVLLVFLVALYWGFRTDRLIWTTSGVHLASYRVSEQGPTAAVHPEVLNLQASFTKVAEIVKPAVVSITTVRVEKAQDAPQFYFGDPMEQFFNQYFGPGGTPSPYGRPRQAPRPLRKFKTEGMGSGVIIDPSGLVLTNEHVVRGADEITVIIYDKEGKNTEYKGRVVGKDARTDIAVVRIHAGHKLPFAALGDSEKVQVGDWAIAIGSPFGLSQTFTVGVISAARQTLEVEDRQYHNLIQTDAAINRGNSGGPLLNIRGEIVGINSAIYAPTGVFAGIGFAIPINQAKAILDELVQNGHVVRGWLGVELAHDLTPAMVKGFGLPDAKGALLNSVLKDSPAEKAGLKRGDVIRSFNGAAVESSDQLQAAVSQTAPKKKVDVEIFRDRKKLTLSLVLGERPESIDTGAETAVPSSKKKEKQNIKTWQGAQVTGMTPELAERHQQPTDEAGVIVTDVDAGSQAEEMGLAPGDLIRAVNQEPTPDASAFERVTGHVKLSEGIVLDVLRQGQPMFLSYTKQ